MKTSELIFLTVTAITLIAMVPTDSFAGEGDDNTPPPVVDMFHGQGVEAFLKSNKVGESSASTLLPAGKTLETMVDTGTMDVHKTTQKQLEVKQVYGIDVALFEPERITADFVSKSY